MADLPELVRSKLEALPASPGVYVFKDKKGGVLYVGKALALRSRVRSYFQQGSSDERYFIPHLANQVGDVETFVTGTEKEAALLENQLIKEHQPRFNVKLRDDKDYLSLRLDPKAPWPRLEVLRRPRPDGAQYFGPYHSATAARSTLRLVNRHFQLRTCTDTEMRSRARPCLQYQIARCPAPCVMEVDREAYGAQVRNVGLFLDGRHDELVDRLEKQMRDAAARMDYEQAAVHRDQLRAVQRVHEDQRVASVKDVDQDVIGFYRESDVAEVAVLLIREGKLVGVRTYDLGDITLPDAELVASFAAEYYARGTFAPDEVLVPLELDAMQGLADVLTERKGAKVQVLVPQRGARAHLIKMAMENATHAFREKARAQADVEKRLAEVQKRLRLPKLPRRIECVDVSHTGGQDTVAAVVALLDGEPDRRRYKSFHVRRVRGGDDYGAMYEVLSRRFRRGREGHGGWELPDLLIVDGGKGQLAIALAALKDLGVADVLPVAALAKEKANAMGDTLVDRVYLPGQKNAIPLRERSATLHFLALARDEAHRVSNALRVKMGRRKRLRSGLDDIPGIGPRTRRLLLSELGSLKAVMEAPIEKLIEVGATKRQAEAIRTAFHGPPVAEGAPEKPADVEEVEAQAIENAFEGVPEVEEATVTEAHEG